MVVDWIADFEDLLVKGAGFLGDLDLVHDGEDDGDRIVLLADVPVLGNGVQVCESGLVMWEQFRIRDFLENRIASEHDRVPGVVSTLVLVVLVFSNLPLEDPINLVFLEGLIKLDSAVSEHGAGDLHACGVHKLEVEDLGELALAGLADELAVIFFDKARNYFPVL